VPAVKPDLAQLVCTLVAVGAVEDLAEGVGEGSAAVAV
jgi:hypothetical protein